MNCAGCGKKGIKLVYNGNLCIMCAQKLARERHRQRMAGTLNPYTQGYYEKSNRDKSK